MIYIFGDSHANMNMNGVSVFDVPHHNMYQNSITMYRIGRDNVIPGFNTSINNNQNIFLFFYGEVDCRCHIARQIALGRELNEIVDELTTKYFQTIKNNITSYKSIIIGSVVPSLRRRDWEDDNGPITHEFPMIGTDEERVIYTKLVNKMMLEKCKEYGFIFFDFFDYYTREDGTLKFELSDGVCHIRDNVYIINSLKLLLNNIN
jgi:hypothetical protein